MLHLTQIITCLDQIINRQRPFEEVLSDLFAAERFTLTEKRSFDSLLVGILRNYFLLDFAASDVIDDYSSRSMEALLLISVLYALRFLKTDESELRTEYLRTMKDSRLMLSDDEFDRIVELSHRKRLLSEEVKKHPYLYNSLNLNVPEFLLVGLVDQYGTERTPEICLSLGRYPSPYCFPKKDRVLSEDGFEEVRVSDDHSIFKPKDRSLFRKLIDGGDIFRIDYSDALFLSKLTEHSLGMKVLYIDQTVPSLSTYLSYELEPHRGELTSVFREASVCDSASELMKESEAERVELITSETSLIKTYVPFDSFQQVIYQGEDTRLADTRISFSLLPSLTEKMFRTSAERQLAGLQEAASFVREGGVLLFYNRSLLRVDSDDVVTAFLKSRADFFVLEEDHLLPYEHESEGGYYCLLRRGER